MDKKSIFIIICIFVTIIFCILTTLPIEIKKGNELYIISNNDSFERYEDRLCYNESVFYNEKRDISITDVDIEKKLFLYVITFEYEEGNLCDKEYVLEEEYINNFINNAEIIENENNIDLAKLIEGKKAIVGNDKYPTNDYSNAIYYTLDGKEEVLYVFYFMDKLVIQVGYSDEGARYIAYR